MTRKENNLIRAGSSPAMIDINIFDEIDTVVVLLINKSAVGSCRFFHLSAVFFVFCFFSFFIFHFSFRVSIFILRFSPSGHMYSRLS